MAGRESVYDWPGVPGYMAESRFVLVAARDHLELHYRPDLRSSARAVPYQSGWRIPFDETLVRTLEVVELSTIGAGSLNVVCEDSGTDRMNLLAGETWTYLRKHGEGRVTARIQGRACVITPYFSEEIFGGPLPEPVILWWVQVFYADGTSPGWLLVDDDVTFGWLPCCRAN